ncbi:MAG: hypothetical protein F6K28_45885 [Microcoleus sp. SIO2G3]|nr:hypothetical protein [Microcoleus sp. SIO2G3]
MGEKTDGEGSTVQPVLRENFGVLNNMRSLYFLYLSKLFFEEKVASAEKLKVLEIDDFSCV